MAAGAVDSPAGGGSGGGQRNKDKQSILPVNIKQVLESVMPTQDSAAKIDGVDVAQVTLAGRCTVPCAGMFFRAVSSEGKYAQCEAIAGPPETELL